ncbi:MAG TPA: L-histidine N(alpha)-methyltransferase, partial [Bryobacteraceae bacterium]
MKVEVVLTEADIAQEFAEAVEARDLPEKFFFWFPRSAAEWSRLIGNAELYGGLADTWRELAAQAGSLAKRFRGKIPVISFGAGDGTRDRVLMMALKDEGNECLYFPVDASQAMLEMACGSADDEDIEAVGIKADISSPVHLVYA